MSNLIERSFDSPDETRTPPKTTVDVVDLDGIKAARMRLEPGWKWSECIKPVAGTKSCESHHIGAVTSGRLHVRHDDGTELDLEPGHVYVIEPGHDAWVVGNEACVLLEFDSSSADRYARTT